MTIQPGIQFSRVAGAVTFGRVIRRLRADHRVDIVVYRDDLLTVAGQSAVIGRPVRAGQGEAVRSGVVGLHVGRHMRHDHVIRAAEIRRDDDGGIGKRNIVRTDDGHGLRTGDIWWRGVLDRECPRRLGVVPAFVGGTEGHRHAARRAAAVRRESGVRTVAPGQRCRVRAVVVGQRTSVRREPGRQGLLVAGAVAFDGRAGRRLRDRGVDVVVDRDGLRAVHREIPQRTAVGPCERKAVGTKVV